MKPPRVVLDTNVLVSALLSKLGNPAKIYKMFLFGSIHLVFCDDIMNEYEDVLYRPNLQIPITDAIKVLDAIMYYRECVIPHPSTFYMIDEDDRKFYDTANSALAYLITGNVRHYPKKSFIYTPADFLTR